MLLSTLSYSHCVLGLYKMREIGKSSQCGLIIHIEQLGYSPQYDALYLQQMIHERGNLRFRSPGWPYHVCELTHAHLNWWRTTFVSGRTCSNMGNEHICNSQVDFFILLPLYVLQIKTTHHNLSPTLLVGVFTSCMFTCFFWNEWSPVRQALDSWGPWCHTAWGHHESSCWNTETCRPMKAGYPLSVLK